MFDLVRTVNLFDIILHTAGFDFSSITMLRTRFSTRDGSIATLFNFNLKVYRLHNDVVRQSFYTLATLYFGFRRFADLEDFWWYMALDLTIAASTSIDVPRDRSCSIIRSTVRPVFRKFGSWCMRPQICNEPFYTGYRCGDEGKVQHELEIHCRDYRMPWLILRRCSIIVMHRDKTEECHDRNTSLVSNAT